MSMALRGRSGSTKRSLRRSISMRSARGMSSLVVERRSISISSVLLGVTRYRWTVRYDPSPTLERLMTEEWSSSES